MTYILTCGVIIVTIAVLTIAALKWEASDMHKLWNKPPVYKIKDRKKREKEYRWYGAYNYENNIRWRMIFVGCVIALAFAYIFLRYYAKQEQFLLNATIVFFIFFIWSYLVQQYRGFHVYRVMASKVKPGIKILEDYRPEKAKIRTF